MPAPVRNRIKIAGTSFFLFCVSLFLTAYSARNPWTRDVGPMVGSIFLRPLESIYKGTSSSVGDFWGGYIALVGVKKENEELRQRLSALETRNSELMELESENSRLKGLLGILEENKLKGISARVIGHDPSNWSRTITVDVGSSGSVDNGMPVLEGSGVVGQVVGVGPTSSRVLLITDHGSGIDAIIQGSRTRGVVVGDGAGCGMEYVLADEEVKVGDRVVTSGMDGVYSKGLLIGIVSSVDVGKKAGGMFQSIRVKPAVDIARIEDVVILTSLNERKRVNPLVRASPSPTATPTVGKTKR